MLATGIKTPVGIKIAGPDLKVIQKIGQQLEKIVGSVEGHHPCMLSVSPVVVMSKLISID
jgi:Cu/Ag efflux pump CusA